MNNIEIKGYKSIKEVSIELKTINILIGSNGSGKSNFISFFDFLYTLYHQKLQEYIALNGGVNKYLHKGREFTNSLSGELQFNKNKNSYSFDLLPGERSFTIGGERLDYNGTNINIASFGTEALIKTNTSFRADYVRNHIANLRKYHFHDTGTNSPFNKESNSLTDCFFLYEDGRNLAAFLYRIQTEHPIVYKRIVKNIQSIAPYFSDFFLQPNINGHLRLNWQDKYTSTVYGPNDLSDGTVRFIALTVLFMQPELPSTIIIDEPELGLHPTAIIKLAGMMKSASAKGAQVIAATQAGDLVSQFQPEDIITVDMENGESQFRRLSGDDFSLWIEEYSLGDLWRRKIIPHGQP